MSTEKEKLEAISHAVNAAERRRQDLYRLKKQGQISRAQMFELDMIEDCIKRGNLLLKKELK